MTRAKSPKIAGGFVALPHYILASPEWAALPGREMKLLLEIARQYTGKNNGDLAITRSVLAARGWTSQDQVQKARDELVARGWIMVTRQGGRHIPSLYAITWLAIDRCGGKLDVASDTVPRHLWKPENARHRETRSSTRPASGQHEASTIPRVRTLPTPDSLHRPAEQIAPPHGPTLHRPTEQAT